MFHQLAPEDVELDQEAVVEVADFIRDDENPILMFALEWCELCWSVRKLRAALRDTTT